MIVSTSTNSGGKSSSNSAEIMFVLANQLHVLEMLVSIILQGVVARRKWSGPPCCYLQVDCPMEVLVGQFLICVTRPERRASRHCYCYCPSPGEVLHPHCVTSDMASILASTAGSISPSTSPRLPSPPPFPEVQIAPKSPIYGTTGSIAAQDADEAAMLKIGATRRIRPGTKASEMASGPPLVPLSEVRSLHRSRELQ